MQDVSEKKIKIRINHINNDGNPIDDKYDGAEGYVTLIDDMGQWHGTWGGIAIIPTNDDYEVISEGV